MLRIEKRILSLPEPIAAYVENVCRKSRLYKSSFKPAHCIIPADSGNGRSHIAQIVSRCFCEQNVCLFSSRELFLEFAVNGSIQNIHEVDASIQAHAEYSREYHGVVVLCLSNDMLAQLHENAGSKLFQLVRKIKEHAVLFIYIPADCNSKHIELIANNVGVGTHTFPPISYSDEQLARLFYDFLPPRSTHSKLFGKTSSYPSFDECKAHIMGYISLHLRNKKTINGVREAAQTLLHDDGEMGKLLSLRKTKKTERGTR